MTFDLKTKSVITMAAVGLSVVAGCLGSSPDSESWGVGETRSLLGDVKAEDMRATLPVGVERSELALSAERTLDIGERVKISSVFAAPAAPTGTYTAAVAAHERITIANSADVGTVFGGSTVQLGAGAKVGLVKAAGGVSRGADTKVRDGSLQVGSAVWEARSWTIDMSAVTRITKTPGAHVDVADQEPLMLEAGPHTSLLVHQGAMVVLSKGLYAFDSLELDEGATMEIDNSEAPVVILVRSTMQLAGTIRTYKSPSNVLIQYAGSASPMINTALRGTLVAPFASVVIPAAGEAHRGAVFARDISVLDNAVIEHVAFQPSLGATQKAYGTWSLLDLLASATPDVGLQQRSAFRFG